jgi:hypothetical protein
MVEESFVEIQKKRILSNKKQKNKEETPLIVLLWIADIFSRRVS